MSAQADLFLSDSPEHAADLEDAARLILALEARDSITSDTARQLGIGHEALAARLAARARAIREAPRGR